MDITLELEIMNKEVIEIYLRHLVDTGYVKFGWNEDVTEYSFVGYRESKSFVTLECHYVDNGKTFSKAISLNREDVLSYIRNNKLDNILS